MKPEVFDLLLDFHLQLIRAKPSAETIANARSILVDEAGPTMKGRARMVLSENLLTRQKDLTDFHAADFDGKTKVYGRAYKKKPATAVFSALKHTLKGVKRSQAAREHGINEQTVKSLQPRFERYANFAEKLNAML